MFQNLWAFLFYIKFIKIMTPFYKKHWRYRKNDPTEQSIVCYCVLRVTYTSFYPEPIMLRILRRRVQWTPQPTEPQKSPALFRLNFECLLKPFNWFALDCKWLISFYMIQVLIKRNFRIDCILCGHQVLSFIYNKYQAGNHMFKVNRKNAIIRCGICWMLTRKSLND